MDNEERLKQFHERNIKRFITEVDDGDEFGVSRIQRVCRVGYNQACYTLYEMQARGLAQPTLSEWLYKLTINTHSQ